MNVFALHPWECVLFVLFCGTNVYEDKFKMQKRNITAF